MEQIIVYKRDGTKRYNLNSYAKLCTVKSAEQKRELLGEDTVTIKIESAEPMEFTIGDYVVIFGDVYTLNKVNEPTKSGERVFENTLVFEGAQYKLLDAQYRSTDAEGNNPTAEFPLVADMHLAMQVLVDNVNRIANALGETWVLGSCIETEYKELTFSNENCLSVLQRLCKEFDTEFEIEAVGDKIYKLHIRKVGSLFPTTFTFGKGGGIYKLKRKNVSSSSVITRLYVEGGTKNITTKYRNGATRLRLGTNKESYIDNAQAIAAFGIKEGSKIFEEIYPHRTGVVTSTVKGDIYSFVDDDMFDLNEKESDGKTTKWLIDGTSAKVKFVSGNLSSYELELSSYNTSTHTFKVKEYVDKRGLKIPSAATAYQIEKGDKYVLLDIVMPTDPYVTDEEEHLGVEGTKFLEQNCQPKVEYELDIASMYLNRNYGGESVIVNIFKVGDYLPIKDSGINVDKAIRIKGFTRDCYSDVYKYKLTISDTVDVSVIENLISDNIEQNKIITINNLTDVARARANWRSTQELLNMVFDGDGYFDATNIRPSSIETLMLSVGNRAGQFVLKNIIIEANAVSGSKPNPNYIVITAANNAGEIVHYAIEEKDRNWKITSSSLTLTNTGAFYVYVKCSKSTDAATIIFSQNKLSVDDGMYYYFPLGVLSSVYNNYRELTTTYGATRITGRTINCGRIESVDKKTYFDLDNSEIGGNIKFVSTSGENMSIKDLEALVNSNTDALGGINDVISSLQEQVDGAVEYWFGFGVPTLTNAPANQWKTDADKKIHAGDLYTDSETGLEYRFTKEGNTYKWVNIPSTGIGQAIQIANTALELADNKAHIFLTANASNTPKSPYKLGDLWITLDTYKMKICVKERTTVGTYVATDWKDAGYTDDTKANEALQKLVDMATDGVITPQEKIALKDEIANIKVDYSTVAAKAKLCAVDYTSYTAAYNALITYTSIIISNMNVNSDVDKTVYNARFSNYYKCRTDTIDAISKGYVDAVEVGQGNYLANSAYMEDTKGWKLSVDSGGGQQGALSIYNDSIMGNVLRVAKPNNVSWWYFGTGFKSKEGNILLPKEKFAEGVTYTVAFWVKASSNTNMSLAIMKGNATANVSGYCVFSVTTSWKRIVFTFTANNLSDAESQLYITSADTFSYCMFTKFVLVEGNKAPEWTSSSYELTAQIQANKDLLQAISNNYTQIDGGLILSTFLKLGAVQKNGAWVESAGFKAMLANSNEIAAYFGGTYAEALAGTKDAMTIIYHNGKLKSKDADITGIIHATDGEFTGKVNATDGTFYGSIAEPAKALGTTTALSFDTGFNFSGYVVAGKTQLVQLPTDKKYAGVRCTIVNTMKNTGYYIIQCNNGSNFLYTCNNTSMLEAAKVYLYGVGELRLRAVLDYNGILRWFIENNMSFSYNWADKAFTNGLPSPHMRIIDLFELNGGSLNLIFCADGNSPYVGSYDRGAQWWNIRFSKSRSGHKKKYHVIAISKVCLFSYWVKDISDTGFTVGFTNNGFITLSSDGYATVYVIEYS